MHVARILTQLLSNAIHKTRIQSLIPVITAIITSKQLRLTQLGRSLNTPGKERSAIRRVDRLLANTYYQEESIDIYKAITQTVVGNQGRPIILVDWTALPNSQNTTKDGEHCALRASLISEGRSITLYEEAHSKKKEGNDTVHQEFLKKLRSVLPSGCRPYIVTDAGYREPWVLVSSLGGFSAISRVIKIYKFRMTIEGSFRDAKSTEFGFSLNENKTIKAKRYAVWLMISTLAYIIAWIVGFAAEKAKLHYDFQANTYRHRRVLSFFYLGCQIIRKKLELLIELKEIQREAWDDLSWNILC